MAARRSATPNNLPENLTSFIGREREIVEVTRLLGATRLLTLTGTGGCGKSRLAVEMTRGLLGNFPDGTWIAAWAVKPEITGGGDARRGTA